MDYGLIHSGKNTKISGSDGERGDFEIWYRTDLKEMRIKIEGKMFSFVLKKID